MRHFLPLRKIFLGAIAAFSLACATLFSGSTPTPLPPTASSTPQPSSTPRPTNTSQPTHTSVPPTPTPEGFVAFTGYVEFIAAGTVDLNSPDQQELSQTIVLHTTTSDFALLFSEDCEYNLPEEDHTSDGWTLYAETEYRIQGFPAGQLESSNMFVPSMQIIEVSYIGKASAAPSTSGSLPRIMTKDETLEAWNAGVEALEELAPEQYALQDYLEVNRTFTYTLEISSSRDLIWIWGWCADDKTTMEKNLEQMDVQFVLDGQTISRDEFVQLSDSQPGQVCTSYILGLTDWPPGEHHITTTLVFKTRLNDGTYDFAPGSQTFSYTVDVGSQ